MPRKRKATKPKKRPVRKKPQKGKGAVKDFAVKHAKKAQTAAATGLFLAGVAYGLTSYRKNSMNRNLNSLSSGFSGGV